MYLVGAWSGWVGGVDRGVSWPARRPHLGHPSACPEESDHNLVGSNEGDPGHPPHLQEAQHAWCWLRRSLRTLGAFSVGIQVTRLCDR